MANLKPQIIDEFKTSIPLDECKSLLKKLPKQYSSMKLDVSLKGIDADNCRFKVHASAVRNTMNMTLIGYLVQITTESTLIMIESVEPNGRAYFVQYSWLAIPVV